MSHDHPNGGAGRRLLRTPQKRGRALVASGAGVALMLLASACGSSSGGNGGSASGQSSGPIKLGISVPLSGSVGSSCGPMNKAMLAWFDHVNKEGGVNGRQLDVDTRDDAYNAARAVTNTKAFVEEKVVAVTGQCGSLQPPAQLPILAQAQIPFLFTFGASTALLNPLNPWYFNLMPAYGEQLVLAVPWMFDQNGAGTVAIVNTATPDSPKTASQVTDAVKKAGGTMVGSYDAPPGTADMSSIVLKMKQKNPDYVVLDMTPQDAARVTKEMAAQKFIPKKNVLGSAAVSQATFLSTVDPALYPKLIVTSDTLVPSKAATTECGKVLKDAGIDIEGVTLRGCGTAQVVAKALEETKPLTGKGIASTLESWNNVTASEIYPPLTFSSTDHVGVSSLYIFGVENGQFVQVGQLGQQ